VWPAERNPKNSSDATKGGFPLALNNRGQVVGFSNLAGDQTAHAFLWPGKDGKMLDLGTLGGSFGTANAINQAGEVAGHATNTGDQAVLAFLWRSGVITNLGTVDGDLCSTGNAINSKRQVVGISTATCDFTTGGHAFLWQNGSIVDLNTLIAPEYQQGDRSVLVRDFALRPSRPLFSEAASELISAEIKKPFLSANPLADKAAIEIKPSGCIQFLIKRSTF
jgi:probable HAF family extracellular repeat protein